MGSKCARMLAPVKTATTPGDASARDLDRADAGMRNGAAHERNMQHAWEVNVGNEAAAAEEQPPILPPRDGSPDKAPCLRIHHSLMMPRTNLQASPCHYPTRHR
jgi:hypothetical protein